MRARTHTHTHARAHTHTHKYSETDTPKHTRTNPLEGQPFDLNARKSTHIRTQFVRSMTVQCHRILLNYGNSIFTSPTKELYRPIGLLCQSNKLLLSQHSPRRYLVEDLEPTRVFQKKSHICILSAANFLPLQSELLSLSNKRKVSSKQECYFS